MLVPFYETILDLKTVPLLNGVHICAVQGIVVLIIGQKLLSTKIFFTLPVDVSHMLFDIF